MLIDWFTVTVQVVNFLILVMLLKRFLYGPILKAIDGRTHAIAEKMTAAIDREKEAAMEKEALEDRYSAFEDKKKDLFAGALNEVTAYRQKLVHEACIEADAATEKWKEDVLQEKDAFLRSLHGSIQLETCTVIRHALRELSDTTLERQITRVFADKIRSAPIRDIAPDVVDSKADTVLPCIIRSAYPLDEAMKEEVAAALRSRLNDELDIQFEISHDSVCGIECFILGFKLSWSLDTYLDDLVDQISRNIEAGTMASYETRQGVDV
jgi:F-type H+-transporting ATPase subunit b